MTAPSSTRLYRKMLDLERSRGVSRTTDAAPAREHLRSLVAARASWSTLERLTGLSGPGLRDIAAGRTTVIRTSHERRVLAVRITDVYRAGADTAHVPGIGAARRVQALLALGWSHDDIEAQSGVSVRNVQARASGRVTLAKHEAVARAYDALSMTPGPSLRTRARALRLGYAPPLAWDDDELDDPTAPEPDRKRWEVAA